MADTSIPMFADELKTLVDVLLPGDGRFPAASGIGAQGLLAVRLRDRLGPSGVPDVLAALAEAAGGATLAALDEAESIEAVRRFEQAEPALFAVLLNALYYSYYEHPLVIEAVRGFGIVYNDAPQPLGYAMEPFTPAPGENVPAAPHGFFLKTDEVRRIALPPAARATGEAQADASER